MKEFLISERYRLEIHWDTVTYEQDGVACLDGVFFSGPVVSDIAVMQENDSINMDFSKQYSKLISSYYIARLSWGELRFTPNKIYLSNVTIINKHINSIPKLRATDYIVVDTLEHESDKHYKNLNYKAYLLNADGTLYNFRS